MAEDKIKKIQGLREYFSKHSLPEDFSSLIEREVGISLRAKYGNFSLKNPLMVAAGQLTRNLHQILKIKKAGFGACVLISVVGEDERGNCSMRIQRKHPTYIVSVYDPEDREKYFPIIHWDGGCDVRDLSSYLEFAQEASVYSDNNFLIVASILCHLPPPEEGFRVREWFHTTKSLFELGYRILEIDFCPSLGREKGLLERENVLRWYRTVPGLVKSVSKDILVYPKLLNLEYGIEFQLEMVENALRGGADGVVVANRIFRKELNTAHGGRELRERNLIQIREIKKNFPQVPISATGGVYSGRHILEYLEAGADNVQILSFLMGKTSYPFTRSQGTRLEKVFHSLMLDSREGLLTLLVKRGKSFL